MSPRARRRPSTSTAATYDQEGSALFEEICTLPEYYLTRCEEEILRRTSDTIAGLSAAPVTLVELGSGNAAKTRLLIAALLRRQEQLRYVPIDICRTVLEESARDLLRDFAGLDILAVAGEYQEGMQFLKGEGAEPRLILWLGSNVGNFHRGDAARFLHAVRDTMQPDDRLLVGADLRKDKATLEAAYDDPRGVTARFNLNLLTRINRELGGHFDLAAFRHRAVYNEEIGRIEMYLDSSVRSGSRASIGWSGRSISRPARRCTRRICTSTRPTRWTRWRRRGLADGGCWTDGAGRFSLNLFVVRRPSSVVRSQ